MKLNTNYRLPLPPNLVWALYAISFLGLSYMLVNFVVHSWDVFWHIRMGLDFLHKGKGLFTNEISYVMQGMPLKNPYVGFQLSMGMVYDLFGWPGLKLLRVLSAGLSLYFLARYAKPWGGARTWVFVLASSFVVSSILWRSMLRPEIWMGPLILASVLVVRSLQASDSWRPRGLAFLIGVLWWNFSTGEPFFYMIFGAYWLDQFLRVLRSGDSAMVKRQRLKPHFLFGLGLFLVGFLGSANHPLAAFLHFDGGWKFYVDEMSSLFIVEASDLIRIHLILAGFFLLHFLSRRQVFWGLLFAVLVWQSISVVKVNYYLGFFLGPALFELVAANQKHLKAWSVAMASVVLVGIQTYGFYEPFHYYFQPDRMYSFRHPADVIEVSQKRGWMKQGRVLAPFGYGSVMSLLFPGVQPNLDGRSNILYPLDVVSKYSHLQANEVELYKVIDEDQPDYIWDSRKVPMPGVIYHPHFNVIAAGARSILLQKNNDDRTLTRFLADPECFPKLDKQALLQQIDQVLPAMTTGTNEHAMMMLAKQLSASTEPIQQQFVTFAESIKVNDGTLRLGARLAFEAGEYGLAVLLTNSMVRPDAKDLLFAAEALINDDKHRVAFYQLQQIEESIVPFPQVKRLHELLLRISEKHPRAIKKAYLEELGGRVEKGLSVAGSFYDDKPWAYRACLGR